MAQALSLVQRGLLAQLQTLNPQFQSEYGVQAILNDVPHAQKGCGLRLHTKCSGKAFNIDIVYMPNLDLYELKAHSLDVSTEETEELAHYPEVYDFELDQHIRAILSEGEHEAQAKGG